MPLYGGVLEIVGGGGDSTSKKKKLVAWRSTSIIEILNPN
jgi:hypothetical protein